MLKLPRQLKMAAWLLREIVFWGRLHHYILLTERGINWTESELQLVLVHSRSLHRMQHYLTPSVIFVMNWESEVLLVWINLLCAQVAILLLLFTCWWHTVCATCWWFQYPKQVTGGFASEFNQEELALVAATYSSVWMPQRCWALSLSWCYFIPSLLGVVLIVFGCVYPFTQDPQESRVFECLPHFGSGMGVLLESSRQENFTWRVAG